MTIVPLLNHLMSIFSKRIFLCIHTYDKVIGPKKKKQIPNGSSAKWTISNNLKGVLSRIANGISRSFPKCWEVLYVKTNKTSKQGRDRCQTVRGCRQSKRQGGRKKIKDTHPRNVLALKGSPLCPTSD